MIFKVRTAFAGFGLLCLTACGTAYISSDVSQFAGDGGVQVVELSPAVVAQANQSAYQPQALPAAFSHIAGAGNGPRGAGPSA